MADGRLEELFTRAKAAHDRGDGAVATALCEEMLALRRNDFNALMLRADVAGALGDFDVELDHLGRAVREQPKNARLRVHIGRRYAMRGAHRQALGHYDRALKLDPDNVEAQAGKAAIYEAQDKYDRARRLLAPHAAGGTPPPVVAAVLLRLLVHDGKIDEAVDMGRRVVAGNHPPDHPLRSTYFGLAKALEKAGAYEAAIEAASAARRILAPPYEPACSRREVDLLIESFPRERVAALPRPDEAPELPVFIVGMPRCGSTLTERIIHAHPRAFGAGEIFDLQLLVAGLSGSTPSGLPYPRCADELDAERISAFARAYLAQLGKRAPKAERISNKHLACYLHLGLINAAFPRARVIHCRRRPLDTCLSCFLERLTPAQAPYITDLETLAYHYRQYERLMAHWRDVLDVPLLEVDYEDLVADQEGVSRRIIEFLGLDWDDACLRFHESSRRDGTLSYDQVRRPMYRSSVGRADRFGASLDPLRRALAGETAPPAPREIAMTPMRDTRMLLKSAISAFTRGDLAAAESTCREILKASRKDVEAISLLGQIANRRGLHDEAAKHFRQCLTIAPKFVTGHVLLGQVLLRQGREREAMARFDKALKLEPGHPPALGAKADAYLLGGRHDTARALLEPEVRAGRGGPALAVTLAEVELQSGDPERAIEIGAERIDRPDLPGGLRYRLGSVLGKALERSGAYDEAFAAYETGNGGIGVRFSARQHVERIDEIIEAYSADRLAVIPRSAVDSALPVFVVGMPRCGSTLVEQILDAHPAVFGAGEIDVVYRLVETVSWDVGSTLPYPRCIEDFDQADVDRLGTAHLEALRALGGDAARVTDKNLWNHLHVGLLALILPGARVIHCRRRPLDTCFSCFAEALPPSQHPYATDLASIGLVYREYERLMDHWRTVLDLEMLEVRYEDVVADQEAWSRRLVDFCGLEWDDACLRYHEAERRALTLSYYDQVRRPIYRSSLGRAARFEAHLGPLVAALAGEEA